MIVHNEAQIEKLLEKKFKDSDFSFKCYSHFPEERDDIWTHKIIELQKKNIPVGYIKLMYYDRDKVQCPLDNVLDYFAVLKSNKDTSPWIQQKDISFFRQFNITVDEITSQYTKEYNEFMALWNKKPTVEIVTVYNENDINHINHNQWPAIRLPRQNIGFTQQGFGKKLYMAAALWLQEENLAVWSSLKQTQDGKNMWKSIEKNPQFILSCETIHKNLNGKPSSISRSSFKIN